MRGLAKWQTLALALPLAVVANGCILIPEIEHRVVELAVGHAVVVPFDATGSLNVLDETKVVDVTGDVDLPRIFEDNGIDASDVKDVRLAGVAYRVVRAESGRTITGGTVEIEPRPTPAPAAKIGSRILAFSPLVSSFDGSAENLTGWITVPLNSTGVAVVNGLLSELLTEAKGGAVAPNHFIAYHVQGTSNPTGVESDFTWEFRIQLTIVGTVRVDVPN